MQKVIHQDCLAGLEVIEDESVDVIVTSPPYNIGIKYASYNDQLIQSEYLQWLDAVFIQLRRVMKPAASFFLNVGNQNKHPWLTMEVMSVARPHFHLQNNIVWAKSLTIGEDSVGHFKPINSPRYLNNVHESLFHLTKTGVVAIDRLAVGVPFKDKSNIARFGHTKDRRCAGNIWYVPYKTVQSKGEKFNHPASYPVELVERCLKLHGGDDLMVLDPFLGTGTTLVAAQNLNHRGIGFELDTGYVRIAEDRLAREKPESPRMDASPYCEHIQAIQFPT